MNIESLPERIPIEETIKAIEYVKHERNIEKLKSYVDDIMNIMECLESVFTGNLIDPTLT